jgi:hypothetical protein
MPKVAENLTKEQRLAGWKRLTDKQQSFLDNFMHKDMTQDMVGKRSGNCSGFFLYACGDRVELFGIGSWIGA